MTMVAHGPYEAKVPRTDTPRGGYRTAEQELADALEGTAPHLANVIAGLVGPARTAELAKAVRRATSLAVRRQAAARLEGALSLVEQGLDGIPEDECVSPEAKAGGAIETCVYCLGVLWWDAEQRVWNVSAWGLLHDRCTASPDGAHRPAESDRG